MLSNHEIGRRIRPHAGARFLLGDGRGDDAFAGGIKRGGHRRIDHTEDRLDNVEPLETERFGSGPFGRSRSPIGIEFAEQENEATIRGTAFSILGAPQRARLLSRNNAWDFDVVAVDVLDAVFDPFAVDVHRQDDGTFAIGSDLLRLHQTGPFGAIALESLGLGETGRLQTDELQPFDLVSLVVEWFADTGIVLFQIWAHGEGGLTGP